MELLESDSDKYTLREKITELGCGTVTTELPRFGFTSAPFQPERLTKTETQAVNSSHKLSVTFCPQTGIIQYPEWMQYGHVFCNELVN